MVVSAWWGRLRVLPLVALALVGLVVVTELVDVPIGAGMSSRTIVVDTPDELAQAHELYAGELELVLTDAAFPAATDPAAAGATADPDPDDPVVRAHVGAGSLRVVVPSSVGLSIDTHVGAGEIDLPGEVDDVSGVDVEAPFNRPGPPGSPRLVLDLSTGVGQVAVEVDDVA
jgi:formylmethanofuran dehydrogenase subunit C